MTTAKPEPLSPLRSVQGSGLLMIVSEFSDSTKLDISKSKSEVRFRLFSDSNNNFKNLDISCWRHTKKMVMSCHISVIRITNHHHSTQRRSLCSHLRLLEKD